jgi:16S rRNA (uracil1498-N3)-methyltransferase
MIVPRFHVPEAAPGAVLPLPEHWAHHAREVLRLRAGTLVHVFDGRGAEFEAVLETVTRREVVARLRGQVAARPESPLHVTVALSPLKGDLMELAIQKCTELGVAAIHPVVTVRTDAAARPALQGSRQERWDKVASGAAAQCGRAVVPDVALTAPLAQLLREPPQGRKVLLWEAPGQRPLRELPPIASRIVLLVGPAGGWETSEVEQILAAGFEPAALGPRILRAETAAIGAMAAVQALWGDLG